MVNYKAVGMRIRSFRMDRDITQEELAFQINTSSAYISNIERGVKKPSLQKLSDIADVLHITVNDLIYDEAQISDPTDDELQRVLAFWEPEKQKELKTNIVNILQIIITE